MKTFFTIHISSIYQKVSLAFGTLLALLLSIFCCLYLVGYFSSDVNLCHTYHTKALAKNSFLYSKQQTISDAHILSFQKKYQVKLPAYDTYYYYIPYENTFSFLIKGKKLNNISVTFLSDSGKRLSYLSSPSKNKIEYNCNSNNLTQNQYLFIKLKNCSTSNLSLLLWVEKSQEKQTKKATSNSTKKQQKQNNSTSQKSKDKNTSEKVSKTKEKLSTKDLGNPSLNPHFLIMKPQSCQNLTFNKISEQDRKKYFKLASTNSTVATVKNNKIYAHSEGAAIIYLQSKDSNSKGSSCLIRVIDDTHKISVRK